MKDTLPQVSVFWARCLFFFLLVSVATLSLSGRVGTECWNVGGIPGAIFVQLWAKNNLPRLDRLQIPNIIKIVSESVQFLKLFFVCFSCLNLHVRPVFLWQAFLVVVVLGAIFFFL